MDARSLFIQMQENDSERAFNALFSLEYDRLFRIAVYFLQNDDLAKEAALDTLATLWERRRTMAVPDDYRRFTFTMVKNRALNLLRKESRYTDIADGELPKTNAASPNLATNAFSTPHDLIEQEEIFETYNNLVASLPDRCREVFCCVKENGLSYAETAAQLQISTKTVDAQLQKALRILREGLERYSTSRHTNRLSLIFL